MRTLPALFLASFLRVASFAIAGSSAFAQVAPPPSFDVARAHDSGVVRNASDRPATVISFPVQVAGARWMRLRFRSIDLPETGAELRVTSVQDGGQQRMSARHCREWLNSTAYMNGGDVQVEVVADPGSGPCRVVLERITAGVPPVPSFTQCGPTDDRALSSDPRAARALPLGCSVWLIDDCGHCFLTAGHCAPSVDTIQFNVPLSNPDGSTNNPPPEDQYAVDPISVQANAGLVGNDWAYFGCMPNTNTGLRPFQRQQASYVLANAPASTAGVTLRITGYGTDTTPSIHNQVQQTSTGTYSGLSGDIVDHRVDTEGGNSGSAIDWEEQGAAIGIHTHGGCTSGGGANSGTAIQNLFLQTALSTPLGQCLCHGEANTYCTGKINSQGCEELVGYSGIPSASAGAGSFLITASNIINNKLGLMFYGPEPAEVPFAGGFRCVGGSLRRVGIQNSGGSPGGADCSGTFTFDMGAWITSGADPSLGAGKTRFAQYYSRDPASPSGVYGLTNGLQFTIGP